MVLGLIPCHDLAEPLVIAMPLDVDIIIRTIAYTVSDLRNTHQDSDEGRMTGHDWSGEVCI